MKDQSFLPPDIIRLIVSRETGQASQAEKEALDHYLQSHPEKQEEAAKHSEIIRQARFLGKMKDIGKDAAWFDLEKRMAHTRTRSASVMKRVLRYAAIVLPFIIGMGFLYFQLSDQRAQEAGMHAEMLSAARSSSATLVLSSGESLVLDDHTTGQFFEDEGVRIHQDQSDRIRLADASASVMHSLIVPRGGEYQLVLSDGSTVWINSDSQLDYPTLFDTGKRKISLRGEAYFDVIPDPDRPFVVQTPDMLISVTGTTFNIQNYPADVAEATVVSGSISVSTGDMPAVDVRPGQQARVGHGKDSIELLEVDVDLYTSWVDGMFRFRNTEIGELARRMQRWYNVDVDVVDSGAAGIRLTGAMEKDRPVEYLVTLIEMSAPVSIAVDRDTLRIRLAE